MAHTDDDTTFDPRAGHARRVAPPVLLATVIAHPVVARIGDVCSFGAFPLRSAVEIARGAPDFVGPSGAGPLGDRALSRRPYRLEPDPAGVRLVPEPGPAVVDERLATGPVVIERDALTRGVVVEFANRIGLLLHLVSPEEAPATPDYGLVGGSQAIATIRAAIQRVADLDVPVLIRGESGVGKELVASAIHAASPRHGRPYLAVNVGALPPQLAASTLFGHVRGAFTGAATDAPGLFRQAHTGTLFLDEVGDTPGDVQVALLRAIEAGEVLPVGARAATKVSVRLIAATDSDLEARIATGAFRSALLNRLAGYTVWVPPLRARREDIARLFIHFLRTELKATAESHRLDPDAPAPWLPASLFTRLVRHDWPGNVRELRNVVRTLAVSNRWREQFVIDPDTERLLSRPSSGTATPTATAAATATATATGAAPAPRQRRPSEITSAELIATLRAHGWRIAPTADALGIARNSVVALIDRCPDIRRPRDLDEPTLRAALDAAGGNLDAAAAALEVSLPGLRLRANELGLTTTGG